MERNSDSFPCRWCWLHRSKTVCAFAMALWIYSLIGAVFQMRGSLHPNPDWLLVPGCGIGIWFFANCVAECKQRSERLFYCIGIVEISIIAVRAVIPMSKAGMLWSFGLAEATLSVIGVVLSGIILMWHFRVRTSAPTDPEKL